MSSSHQKQWIADLLEGLPSIVFILLWRQGGDLETAGWAGSALALGVFVVFGVLKVGMHPVLLGVNLHILVATPLIVGLYQSGHGTIADLLAGYSHGGVLLTVLLAGIGQAVFRKGGYVGFMEIPVRSQRRISLLMLVISGFGAVWALSTPDSSFVPVLVTLTVLIVGRRFLLARWADRRSSEGAVILGAFPVSEPYATEISA